MVNPLIFVLSADAKTDDAEYLVHDPGDIAPNIWRMRIRQDGFVTAGDVVADTRRADRICVGYNAANRHSVAQVMVRHQRHAIGGPGAGLDLPEGAFVYRRTPNRNVVD